MCENKMEQRREALITLATRFQELMEHDDKLRALIEQAQDGEADAMEPVVEAAHNFKCMAAQIIGSLAMISAHIDNTSAAMYLHTVASQFIDFEMENDPADILRGILEGLS